MNFFRKRSVAYTITSLMVICSTIINQLMYEPIYLETLDYPDEIEVEAEVDEEEYFSYGIQDIQLFNYMQSNHRTRYGLNASFFAPRFMLSVFTQISPPLSDFVEATVPVFTQLGSVNSLMGTHMHTEGYIVDIISVGDIYGGILLITEHGKIFLNVGFTPSSERYLEQFFEIGNLVRVYFLYNGLSLAYNLPIGNLIAIRHKTTTPLENNFVADYVFSYTEMLLLPYRNYFSEISSDFFDIEPAALGFFVDFLYMEGSVTLHRDHGFVLSNEIGEILVTPYSFQISQDYFENYFSVGEQIRLYFIYIGIHNNDFYTIAVAFERLDS